MPKPEDLVEIFSTPAGRRCRVIKVETAHIEEVRGIRDLDIEFHGKAGK